MYKQAIIQPSSVNSDTDTFKKALQNAAQSSNPHYELFRSTAGVVFLGTPLQGTRVARFETWRVMIEGILGKDSSPSLVKDLSEKSENLRNLTGNFAEIAVNNSLRIHCFYETRKSTILRAILPRFTAKLLPSSRVIVRYPWKYGQLSS